MLLAVVAAVAVAVAVAAAVALRLAFLPILELHAYRRAFLPFL